MAAIQYVPCLWPGLPEMWYRGRWNGLPAAIIFACAVNFLLVARFIYPEWLMPSLIQIACWVGVAVWITTATKQISQLPALLNPRTTSPQPDPFPEAQTLFLQNQLSEAEAKIATCLETDERDCQALLLLAAIYRRTERYEAAERTLDLLARLESADSWWLECQTERRKLERARQPTSADDMEDHTSSEHREFTQDR